MNQSPDHFELHLDIDEPAKAVDLLADHTSLSRTQIKQAMQNGAVWLTLNARPKRLRRASKLLNPGEKLSLYYDKEIQQSQIATPQLIADEEAFSVWFKPYGCYSQGSKWGDHTTLARWVEMNYFTQRSVYLVHRLDRATSGLMLLAHNKKSASELSDSFERREVIKIYHAIVAGRFPDKSQEFTQPIDGKAARSVARLIQYSSEKNRSLLSVQIFTGRKHQIRRHLSEAGFPVVGDRLYAKQESYDENLQLMSVELGIRSPMDQQQKRYLVLDQFKLSLG